MKMNFGHRIVTAVIACMLFVGILSSCAAPAVITCGNITMTEGMYHYAYSCYKYLYLSENKSLGITDSEAGWQATAENGKTHAENFHSYFEEALRTRMTAAYIYENTPSLSSGNAVAVKNAVEKVMEETFYYADKNTESAYNEMLSPYGATYDDAFRVALYEHEYRRLYYLLFGKNGEGALSDESFADDVLSFYRSYYVRLRLVVATGDKIAAADSAFYSANTDEAFDAFVEEYAENEETDLFLCIYGSYYLPQKLMEKIATLEVGKNGFVDVDGTVYYLRRYATNAEYKEEAYADHFKDFPSFVAPYCYALYLDEFADQFKNSVISPKSIWDVPSCKDVNAVDVLKSRS